MVSGQSPPPRTMRVQSGDGWARARGGDGGSLRLSFGWASIDLPPCLPRLSPPSLSSSPLSSVLYGVTCMHHVHPGRFRAKHWPPVLRSLACPRRQPANPEALRAAIDMSILLQGCPCCCLWLVARNAENHLLLTGTSYNTIPYMHPWPMGIAMLS